MGLVVVQRRASGASVMEGGTQYIEGTLSITSQSRIYLDPTVFTTTGTYTLFDYTAGSFDKGTYATPQACLNDLLRIDTSLLNGLAANDPFGTDHSADPTPSKTITVTLV